MNKLIESFRDFLYVYSLNENIKSEYSKAADRIKDVYLNNMNKLSYIKKQHFLSRLSKVYGNNWNSDVTFMCKKMITEVENLFLDYSTGSYEKSIYNFIDLRIGNNADDSSKKRGNDWVLENKKDTKKVLAFLEILMKTNIIHRLKCENLFDPDKLRDIKSWLISNWEKNIDYIIENPISFKMIPVQSINIFYYMESLNWINPDIIDEKEKIFLETFKGEYKTNTKESVDFNNYLYALTHIIIGKSWFYEIKIPEYREKYDWIIEFLSNNEKRIQDECTPDIVIEIGVVFLICNEIEKAESYKKYAFGRLNDDGIIPTLNKDDIKNTIEIAEHSNILAIMLLKGF